MPFSRSALTPDTVPAFRRALLFTVPYNVQWQALIVGAVAELANSARWELAGAVSVSEATEVIAEILLSARWENTIGQIAPFMTSPDGWLLCNGARYASADYPELAAQCGAVWHIDPNTLASDPEYFWVPDLRGRAAIGTGQGVGLTNRAENATVGTETHALTPGQLAAHTHGMNHQHAYSQTTYLPGLAFFPGELPVVVPPAIPIPAVTGVSSALVTGNAGSGFAHPNMQPSLALNWYVRAK